jgi:dCTP deaminase
VILTDREIKNSLAAGLIKITPEPAADAYDSTSVDLTLDKVIRVFKASTNGLEINVDPGAPGFKARELLPQVTDQREIPPEGYTLKPKVLILAWTAEIIKLQPHGRVAARVEGKSSLERFPIRLDHSLQP